MRQEMFEDGYTIVDGMVEPDLLQRLIAASRRCVQEAFDSDDKNLHGGLVLKEPGEQGPNARRGVMMPGWNAPEFAEYLGSDRVLDCVRGFLNVEKEDLMMPDADCILYVGHKDGSDRAQGWHRDSQEFMKLGYGEDGQRQQYEYMQSEEYWPQVGPFGGPFDPNVPGSGGLFGHSTYIENNPGAQWVRWELALVDHEIDSGVDYVPGSHNRWRSDFENEISLSRQLSEQALADIPDIKGVKPAGMTAAAMSDGESGESLMPGGGIVQIKAGQTVFWNGDGFHRGRSREGKERISLACGWAGPPPQGWENVNKDMTPRQVFDSLA